MARWRRTERGRVFLERMGSGPPVLLLHGFPQTGLMWRDVAPLLAADHEVFVADLPGYGRSEVPLTDGTPERMAKRAMAEDLVEAMARKGCSHFAVVGHDRGGRVAYRMALDHPDVVSRLGVLDVIPTGDLWVRADAQLALAFWPFIMLAQPAPLPETLLRTCAEVVVDDALSNWGSPREIFDDEVREAYIGALRRPEHAEAICDEYRAAATVDRDHDAQDCAAQRVIRCPTLVLWSDRGGLANWYEEDGGPLGIWKAWAPDLCGQAVRGGHFFPEEHPAETARLIARFLDGLSLATDE